MSRRLGAFGLTLALIAVIAAAVIPSCADSLCCARDGDTAMQAQMPCCEPSISQRDFELQPATSARSITLPPVCAPTAVIEPQLAEVVDVLPAPAAQHPPSPPLFLLNAQFLI